MADARESVGRGAQPLDRRAHFVLWLGVLAPPTLFLVSLTVAYSVIPFACLARSPLALHLTSLAFLIATLLPGVLAWREWQRAGREWPDTEYGPLPSARFMGALGAMGSAFFSLLVIAQWAAMLIVPYCRR
jgi:hypothetical protein